MFFFNINETLHLSITIILCGYAWLLNSLAHYYVLFVSMHQAIYSETPNSGWMIDFLCFCKHALFYLHWELFGALWPLLPNVNATLAIISRPFPA